MPTIISHALEVKRVRNLGWLLRNWTNVAQFSVCAIDHTLNGFDAGHDCMLVAQLRDGGQYVTTFASVWVLWAFLHRPVFYGLVLNWFGEWFHLYQSEDNRGTSRAALIARSLGYWFPEDK